jgi:glucose-1-phosphate cytidylyltransferase
VTKVVILAGGLGTRLREETEFKPKPMVEIGGVPILVHIIKNFLTAGFTDIIIATGYKGNQIKEYFYNYDVYTNDLRIDIGGGGGALLFCLQKKKQSLLFLSFILVQLV